MEELIKKAQEGDKEAFTDLILQFKDDLYKIAKSRLKEDEDVYDAIQETIMIAFQSISKLKQIKSFKAWLIKILINESNNIYRKKKKIISLNELEQEEGIKDTKIEYAETKLDFNFFCNNLKYEDRIIVLLYYMEQFTDAEIGKILNIKENTVKTKRTRAKQEIKNKMKGT